MSQTIENESTAPGTVVVGVGNLLLKDDGVGIHIVKMLQEAALPRDIRLIDGGTSPDLMAYVRRGDRLIIIDAAKAGAAPGTVYRFHPDDLTAESAALTSAHEMGVVANLKLMALAGNEPAETIIIGIEPAEIDFGLELSAALQQKIPQILHKILREIGHPAP